MSIDMNKTYQTRSGKPARILCTDKKGNMGSVVAVIETSPGIEQTYVYGADGRLFGALSSDGDLVEVKPRIKKTIWLNLQKSGCIYAHPSEDAAKRGRTDSCGVTRNSGYLACVKVDIDVEEGSGL